MAGHARSVGRLWQCRDRRSNLRAWLARAVVVFFFSLKTGLLRRSDLYACLGDR